MTGFSDTLPGDRVQLGGRTYKVARVTEHQIILRIRGCDLRFWKESGKSVDGKNEITRKEKMMSEVTDEQLDKARALAEQAQVTNINVLLIAMQGNEKAKRVRKKTQRRAERRLAAWSEMLYEWASGRKP